MKAFNFEDLSTPAFIVDLDVVKRNCQNMIDMAKKYDCVLRPHMKTHKTLEIGELMAPSKKKISVSTLAELEFFANGGFDDILFAIPITEDKLKRVKAIHEQKDVSILVNTVEVLEILEDCNKPWKVLIEVSTGYERSGINVEEEAKISKILSRLLAAPDRFTFMGIYNHCGHTYLRNKDSTVEKIEEMNKETVAKLKKLRDHLEDQFEDAAPIFIGTGSTPGCGQPVDEFGELDELHPGNYCFYDYCQETLGSCKEADIGAFVLSRVNSVFESYIVIDAGFLAISKDSPELDFGKVLAPNDDMFISGMSQEAGKLKLKSGDFDLRKDFNNQFFHPQIYYDML
ncbi:Oidioi.mRNA.OKI2018_I69.PAR.g11200.t1.cds [Oikopleura dioica]|uniref:Oidioi.mRNA.OKI2018_I69.PAR.g11200.t1.cds n=1 Tax=Oikopleura dioica TaxID=34765 RepID=A0ABN7S0Z3_OIKDI|nr:Oidioi.mRNA.OKI2018_I69.PAR.g11200.t1.cds [Oikopleura dioica]